MCAASFNLHPPVGCPAAHSVEQLIGARVWAEVNLQALAHNISSIVGQVGPVRLLLAVKKDAYGHGLIPVSRAAEQAGVDYLGIACVGEGVSVRNAGITMSILNLGVALAEEIEEAILNKIDLTVACLDDARRISDVGRRLNRTARVHLKIDTGMGRLGFFPEQLLDQVDATAALPNLEWISLYSHLAESTTDSPLSREQRDRFEAAISDLSKVQSLKSNVHFGCLKMRHLGASGALTDRRFHFDMLRVGIAAYGADARHQQFEPVMTFKSRLVFIKDFPPGRTISYGATYTTTEPTRVGVVAAGYGNGYPRLVSNRGHVALAGRPAPILGRVCMDQMMIGLNNHPEAKVGDVVLLFGRGDGGELPVWQVAEWAETISYETLCCVGAMNQRVYYQPQMHTD